MSKPVRRLLWQRLMPSPSSWHCRVTTGWSMSRTATSSLPSWADTSSCNRFSVSSLARFVAACMASDLPTELASVPPAACARTLSATSSSTSSTAASMASTVSAFGASSAKTSGSAARTLTAWGAAVRTRSPVATLTATLRASSSSWWFNLMSMGSGEITLNSSRFVATMSMVSSKDTSSLTAFIEQISGVRSFSEPRFTTTFPISRTGRWIVGAARRTSKCTWSGTRSKAASAYCETSPSLPSSCFTAVAEGDITLLIVLLGDAISVPGVLGEAGFVATSVASGGWTKSSSFGTILGMK
mmetsp:Transcript_26500/g.61602  ORF Transcript_26500/g.61602 Transcript_26500/m.61602 type:complete len:300 (-) Transcript_26500:1644-2543(-)